MAKDGPIEFAVLLGSLRKASFNAMIARALPELAPDGVTVRLLDSVGDYPHYDADLQAEGFPAIVTRTADAIRSADALVFVTPEYNYSIPGALKNAIDWLSRPADDIPRVFGGRPFALAGASPGGFGTVLSQAHWLPVLKTLGVDLWAGGRLLASRSGSLFDADGALVDDKLRTQLAAFVQGFAGYVAGKRG